MQVHPPRRRPPARGDVGPLPHDLDDVANRGELARHPIEVRIRLEVSGVHDDVDVILVAELS